jgi:hypothetical protein
MVWTSAWNASICNWVTTNAQVDSVTGTSATDSSEPFSVSSYTTTSPDGNTYSFVMAQVLAYNAGILTFSGAPIFFQGAANGAGGTSCNGGGGIMQVSPPGTPIAPSSGISRK